MRATLFAVLTTTVFAAAGWPAPAAAQPAKEPAKATPKGSPAAELTRTVLLKARMTAEFTDIRVGDILKEFAHQVDEQTSEALMWAYGTQFPFSKKVTFAAKDQPLDAALDELFRKAGGGLGYVVVSKPGDKYDGWVKLTTTGERGYEPPPASKEDEEEAAERLARAKKFLENKKTPTARGLLESIVNKYPTTKAVAEAKELLGKLEK